MRFQSPMGLPSLLPSATIVSAVASDAVKIIHYAYPPVLLVYFAVALLSTFWFRQKEDLFHCYRPGYRSAMLWANLAVVVTYIIDLVTMLGHSLAENGWWASDDAVLYSVISILAWGILHMWLIESHAPIGYPYWGSWITGVAAELSIVILSLNSEITAPEPNIYESAQLWLRYLRIIILLFFPILFWRFHARSIETVNGNTDETDPLLEQPAANGKYGAIVHVGEAVEDEEEKKKREFQEKYKECGWLEYAKSFKIILPSFLPQKDRALWKNMALVGVCVVMERGLAILTPLQMGRITNTLMAGGLSGFPVMEIFSFVLIRWLGSSAGVPALHQYLWKPVNQCAHRTLITAAYNHVMSLSTDFHTSKRTGEICYAVNQVRAVIEFVDLILFSVFPMFADLVVAFAYFYIKFGIYMALIVTFTSCAYAWITARLKQRSVDLSRTYFKYSRENWSLMQESMASWETVIYFNRVGYEQSRYTEAVKRFQAAKREYDTSTLLLEVTQSATFTIGLLFASLLAVYQVTSGKRGVGDFVTLLSYWGQISGPLSFFSNMYRRLQSTMIDAELLLEVMQKTPSVTTKPGAKDLVITKGEVRFQNVSFNYEKRQGAIKNMSFQAPGGKTTALVGMSGGGKSTCIKLLLRLYDVADGAITIDGQDLREVSLGSLREQIGVVPQEPKLFNQTIMENLRYARLEASDEEIYSACRSAAIHDKILTFPDGYLSVVGENGVKLSGGEKQRIALARAILKAPKIVLLDEATSAVDVTTERLIQQGLGKLAAGRTMFIIAHRLTTIMNADQILVIEDGDIIEKGTHDELLRLNGKYTELWHGNKLGDNSNLLIKDLDENQPIQSLPKSSNSILKPEAKEFVPASMKPTEETGGETTEQKHRRQRHRRRSRSSRSSSGNDKPTTGLKERAPNVPLSAK